MVYKLWLSINQQWEIIIVIAQLVRNIYTILMCKFKPFVKKKKWTIWSPSTTWHSFERKSHDHYVDMLIMPFSTTLLKELEGLVNYDMRFEYYISDKFSKTIFILMPFIQGYSDRSFGLVNRYYLLEFVLMLVSCFSWFPNLISFKVLGIGAFPELKKRLL